MCRVAQVPTPPRIFSPAKMTQQRTIRSSRSVGSQPDTRHFFSSASLQTCVVTNKEQTRPDRAMRLSGEVVQMQRQSRSSKRLLRIQRICSLIQPCAFGACPVHRVHELCVCQRNCAAQTTISATTLLYYGDGLLCANQLQRAQHSFAWSCASHEQDECAGRYRCRSAGGGSRLAPAECELPPCCSTSNIRSGQSLTRVLRATGARRQLAHTVPVQSNSVVSTNMQHRRKDSKYETAIAQRAFR